MELETEKRDGGITLVKLRGRMDVRGAQEIGRTAVTATITP